MNKLMVIGGGGFAREVIWLARECSQKWDVIGVLDDNSAMIGKTICGVQVLGSVADFNNFKDASFIVAIGAPRTRKLIVNKLNSYGNIHFATLIHSSVLKSEYVEIGVGSIVTAGCILTTQVSLGQHSIINLACTIGHDVVIGDFCTFAPNVAISGNVNFGNGVEIGTGSSIVQGLTLGHGSFVGAGSVITKDIKPNVFAVGSPARQIRSLEEF